MTDSNELLPEEGDEQHQRLIRDLRLMYSTEGQKAQHLARIHQRLINSDVSMPMQLHQGVPGGQRSFRDIRPTRSTMGEGKPWQHRLSMIAATLVVTLVVSSILLVLNRAHHTSIGTPAKPTGGLNMLLSLHMIDASTGWALSEHTVLRTSDGGVHWTNVTPPGTTLTQSSIADFRTASIASIATPQANGATTQVLHTADGGQAWQKATIQMPFPRQVSFIDSQHGWILAAVRPLGGAAEPVSVFRTTDGGKTWVNVATALFSDATPAGRLPYGGQKSGMHFLNALTGWVTGTTTLSNLAWLYVTHDGGSTWHQQMLPMPPGMPSAHLSILSPTFLSAADGILPVIFSNATTDSEIATAIYTTHDGGQTWQSTMPVSAAVRILSFADIQHWWATDGTILYSTGDGGNHWTKLSPGGSFKNIVQLDFISDTVGWAISSTAPASSTLLKTIDGGQTWTTISSTVS
ncbi:MAG: WD40/YVTN/BNR-like repeat-containing protein [Ktedonobacteraceae bacterium]